MVKFTIEQLRVLMDKTHNIRNMSVIAHGAPAPQIALRSAVQGSESQGNWH
jgi:hypothetical protein